MIKILKNLYLSEKGATAVEYGLMVSLVALAALAAIYGLAGQTGNTWGGIANQVTEASN